MEADKENKRMQTFMCFYVYVPQKSKRKALKAKGNKKKAIRGSYLMPTQTTMHQGCPSD